MKMLAREIGQVVVRQSDDDHALVYLGGLRFSMDRDECIFMANQLADVAEKLRRAPTPKDVDGR